MVNKLVANVLKKILSGVQVGSFQSIQEFIRLIDDFKNRFIENYNKASLGAYA